ncbi:TolC family protein [Imperialibacter roseus]|uniref:TolC family protein n=1 Tax=Imperialibacter roseus TaxID=1324217 RepID=A0ABZ0IJW1_9BACT|nr:TolC family protein [Imperialibacter roseus]WOK04285.1 TolC family protein [Imperialibacter roseus]
MRLFIFICLLSPMTVFARQEIDVAKEIELVEVLLSNEAAIDSLVELALVNSYYLKSFDSELAQQYENVKQEKNKWLSTFRMGINFFSLNTSLDGQNQSVTTAGLLPNLGITLGIDPEKFINRRSYIREAEYNIVRAENSLKNQRKAVRTQVVDIFYTYLEALGIAQLRISANQTQSEQVTLVTERFRKGEAGMEEVLLTQNGMNLTQEAVLKAELSVRKIRRQISIMISDTEAASATSEQ